MAFKLDRVDDAYPPPLLRFEVADAGRLNRSLIAFNARCRLRPGAKTGHASLSGQK